MRKWCGTTGWPTRRYRQTDAMQATVRRFDPRTRSGDVLLDDGSVLEFPARAFDASGLRLLRLGQRVAIETEVTGAVHRVGIVGIG